MPRTSSNPVRIGSAAVAFSLIDGTGNSVALSDFRSNPALLVAFISNRCPFVVLLRQELASFAREYDEKGLAIVAINSNDATEHPEEGAEELVREAREQGYVFPYVKDETQDVAKAYQAACTPDFFLYDQERKLAYHGQFDDARPGNGKPVTGADLRAAVDAVLVGKAVEGTQFPSIGCNIKWTEGNEPDWFPKAA